MKVVEEIIGDIKDEFDEEETKYYKADNGNYIFDGKMLIVDMCRVMGIAYDTFDEVRGESDSVAGLILEIAGKFPEVQDAVGFNDHIFTILEIDKLRIAKVEVSKTNTPSPTTK